MARTPRVGFALWVLALHFDTAHATDLCLSLFHAWVLHENECPSAKSIATNDSAKAEYDELGCGLGKTVFPGSKEQAAEALVVSEGRKAGFGPIGVYSEIMPKFVCHPRYRIPIPDSCGRGIVADIQELYAMQNIKYFVFKVMRIAPWRMNMKCSKSREHYLAKLHQAGKRNCWGLTLDFKAMYCVFYGGLELYAASQEGSAESPEDGILCSGADCCAESRRRAREYLAPLLRGEKMPVDVEGSLKAAEVGVADDAEEALYDGRDIEDSKLGESDVAGGTVLAEVDAGGEALTVAVAGGRGGRLTRTLAHGRGSRLSPGLDIDA